MHASHHADLFEEFCHPPSSSNTNTTTTTTNANNTNTNSSLNNSTTNTTNNAHNTDQTAPAMIPGQFLPFEEIFLPAHLMPINPEDEDDVVPDMHAAFGIQRALAHQGHGGQGQTGAGGVGAGGEESTRGAQQEPVWRDLGLDRMLDNGGLSVGAAERRGGGGAGGGGGIMRRVEGSSGDLGGLGGLPARREGRRTGVLLMR